MAYKHSLFFQLWLCINLFSVTIHGMEAEKKNVVS